MSVHSCPLQKSGRHKKVSRIRCPHVFIHADIAIGKGWGRLGNKADLLASFSGFPLPMRKLLAKAPEHGIKVWDLYDCPEIEEWTKGRAALVGDAAHPFLPCKFP